MEGVHVDVLHSNASYKSNILRCFFMAKFTIELKLEADNRYENGYEVTINSTIRVLTLCEKRNL